MKILHTSDIHIHNYKDERWNALEQIISLCKSYKVNILVIAGDMFDKGVDGESLRPYVRRLFEDSTFTTLILPGNHDWKVFERGNYWGNNVIVITDYMMPYRTDKADFWGLPYEELNEREVLERLYEMNEKMSDKKTNILIFHGELIDNYRWLKGFGDEGEKRYMPVKKSYFKNTKIKYVLAGHFHKNFDVITFANNGYFVYPGSPVSITAKEMGKRKVNLFEIGKVPKEVPIDTFHYEHLNIDLDPFSDKNPMDCINEKISSFFKIAGSNCKVSICIRGYINSSKFNITEKDISCYLSMIKQKNKAVESISNEVRNLSYVLSNEIFKKFVKELKEKDITNEEKRKITEYVIRAMLELF